MHLLTVFAHPFTDKYPRAVMDAFHVPVRLAGHTIDVLDLHTQGLDPWFTEADCNPKKHTGKLVLIP